MKKWLYFILPLVMFGIFLVFYFQHEKERAARTEQNLLETAAKTATEKAVKDEAEGKARESARIAQEERDRENAARNASRKAQQDAVNKDIKDKTDVATAEINDATRKIIQLEAEVTRLVQDRERITREAFNSAKDVELAMVARRNAEMEEQRFVEMIVRRTTESHLTRLPPPLPPPAPTRR
jgi:hypothetical protein